jgi:hypothetical protein
MFSKPILTLIVFSSCFVVVSFSFTLEASPRQHPKAQKVVTAIYRPTHVDHQIPSWINPNELAICGLKENLSTPMKFSYSTFNPNRLQITINPTLDGKTDNHAINEIRALLKGWKIKTKSVRQKRK